MRRTLYALAAFTILAIGGCKKDDEAEIHGAPLYGSVRFINQSADRYDIFLDNNRLGDLYGGDSATFVNITPRAHQVAARQTGNIVGTATYRTVQVYVDSNKVSRFIFP